MQTKTKVSRKGEIKIRAEINEIEKINETRFFWEINKIDKPLAGLIREKKGQDTNCQYQEWDKLHHYRFYRYLNNNKGIPYATSC